MTTGKSNLVRTFHVSFILLSLNLGATLLPAAAVELSDNSKVGDAGDVDNLLFDGLQSFTDEQIRRALTFRPSYLLAAHPQADRQEFLVALQKKVLGGYQATGFPDARVEVVFDTKLQKARVSVFEGPQFKTGQIRVLGAKTVSVPELARWFTTSFDKSEDSSGLNTPGKASRSEDPMWKTGKSVDFTASWQTNAIEQIEACLADQGFFFPKSTVELQRNPASKTADLVITIQDEGPAGVIDKIKVTGQSLHSAADITQFLQLRKGQHLTDKRLIEARRKLRDCGRFWYFTIAPEYPRYADKVSSRHVNLLVEVKEMEGVPHLSKPLSSTQQALVRLCEWFERFPSRDEDFELKLVSTNKIPFNIRAVVSPKHGFLLNSADLHGASPVSAGFEVTDKMIQFAAWAAGAKIASESEGSGNFFLRLLPNEDKSDTNRFNLSFGAGLSGEGDSDKTPRNLPLKFDIQITRAALLDLQRRKDSSCRIQDGELVMSNEDATLRADAKSGRLISINVQEGSANIQVRSGKGIWNQASGDFERRAAALTNAYAPGQGFATFFSIAAAEALRWKLTTSMDPSVGPEERTRAVSALRKLVSPEFLIIGDRLLGTDETNRFNIPVDGADAAITEDLQFITIYIFAASKELFSKNSWPWTVAREATFLFMNQGRYTGVELERLCNSEETGPFGFLVIAGLLAEVNQEAAMNIAQQGLTRLSAQDFLHDCNLFLRGDSGLARSFAKLAATLRALPESELTALIKVLPENEATLLREIAAALHAQPDAPLDSALSPAILKYWDARLRADVRSALMDLSKPKSQDEEKN